jgi:hypothetical protein
LKPHASVTHKIPITPIHTGASPSAAADQRHFYIQ